MHRLDPTSLHAIGMITPYCWLGIPLRYQSSLSTIYRNCICSWNHLITEVGKSQTSNRPNNNQEKIDLNQHSRFGLKKTVKKYFLSLYKESIESTGRYFVNNMSLDCIQMTIRKSKAPYNPPFCTTLKIKEIHKNPLKLKIYR